MNFTFTLSRWKCGNCGEEFTDLPTMKTHLETHLTSPQHLEAQQLEAQQPHHQQARERHKCLTCSDVFATAQELASHSKTHVPPADEVCTLPKRNRVLNKHMISKVTSVKCDQCDASFSSKTALTRHQNVHQERPFRCGHATCCESYRTVKKNTKLYWSVVSLTLGGCSYLVRQAPYLGI